MPSFSTVVAATLLATAQLVAGHGAIVSATGNAGGQGMAIGVVTTTPRDGTGVNPFQQDTTRFRGSAADTVGETLGGGNNNIEQGTQQVIANTGGQPLPQVTPGGSVQMTLHQVNADGAGPYECMINADGTAQTWTEIDVTEQVRGRRGFRFRSSASPQPLSVAIPANQQCTGQVAGEANVCLVRCQNPARAGPFGGVVPVQMAGANNKAKRQFSIRGGAKVEVDAVETY